MSGRHQDYEENSNLAAKAADVANTLKLLQDRAYNQIYGEVEKSVQRISHLRDNAEDESIQLKASQDILDRAGLIPATNLNVTGKGFNFSITPEQLSNIEEAKKLMEGA